MIRLVTCWDAGERARPTTTSNPITSEKGAGRRGDAKTRPGTRMGPRGDRHRGAGSQPRRAATGLLLFVEPDVLEAPAVVGAVDHDVQPLDLRPPAGRLAQVELDRPHHRLLQSAVDLPDEPFALFLIAFHRLLVDHFLDFLIAVMRIVAVRFAAVI